jgi:uncharacterized membrane protein
MHIRYGLLFHYLHFIYFCLSEGLKDKRFISYCLNQEKLIYTIIILSFSLFCLIAIFYIQYYVIVQVLRIGGYHGEIICKRSLLRLYDPTYKANNKYNKIILTMLIKDVIIFVWSLLFIIPGIIKYYSYKMVPYILAENQDIGCKKALKLSKQMTKGSRLKMLKTDLSFIGGYILGILTLGIGILLIRPYKHVINTRLYLELKEEAIKKGLSFSA